MEQYSEELAPKVKEILESSRKRDTPSEKIVVEPRSFQESIKKTSDQDKNPIISEIKPTSPTTKRVREEDPAELARKMEDAGASAISVLTEEKHFGGSAENLRKARKAVDIPVLRKDFILDEKELDRVKADMVLLIARFLDNLSHMIKAACERGFQPLVEVHTRKEMRQAIQAGAEIIGINNRDLGELEVNLETFEKVSNQSQEGTCLIAESGITTEEEAQRMMDSGADAMLIGTAIMDGDVKKNIKQFTNAGGDHR